MMIRANLRYAVVTKYTVVGIDLQKAILAFEYTMGITLKFLPAFWTYFIFGNSPFAIL